MDYHIGETLAKIRKEQGLTQNELAKSIGVHSSSIYRYESGLISPPIAVLEKIAKVFDMSVPALLDKHY